jgi:5-methylcytosine-specific restriction enzyme subunit McrC
MPFESRDKFRLVVYEHESVRLKHRTHPIEKGLYDNLVSYYGTDGVPYFSLIHNGIKFNQFVGVLQIGDYTIEVLPKTDHQLSVNSNEALEKKAWQQLLIDMLKAANFLEVHAPSSAALNLKSNSLLDLYFELLINEVEQLLRRGLVKEYRRTEGNCSSLKGSLHFTKHIRHNLVHKERFYVKYSIYDRDTVFNSILRSALQLTAMICRDPALQGRAQMLLLDFPEGRAVKDAKGVFSRLRFNRKTEAYVTAIQIARLLLLNYHPDVIKGREHVLAIMFDMNTLWEKFVATSLQKNIRKFNDYTGFTVRSQSKFQFWKIDSGRTMSLKPDLKVASPHTCRLILDTKWKNISGAKPIPEDLRQVYTYSKFHNDANVILVYPGTASIRTSQFLDKTASGSQISCNIVEVPVMTNMKLWQQEICRLILQQHDRAFT